MSKPFDYSKWDNIELSDDEDDVHPNIDRESWFRMKHRSRVEREEREEKDKKKICEEMAKANLRIKEINKILAKSSSSAGDDEDSDDDLEDIDGLKAELLALQKANAENQAKLDQYEKNKKWNVDNMCRVVEERTIVNKNVGETKFTSSGFVLPSDAPDVSKVEIEKEAVKPVASDSTTKDKIVKAKLTDEKKSTAPPVDFEDGAEPNPQPQPDSPLSSVSVSMLSYHEFTQKYADVVEKFMAIESLDRSKDFLLQNGNILLQENASNYLLLASLEDEMNGFHEKMKLVARQSQIISNIAELARSLQRHPGNVIVPFFQRLDNKELYDGFMEGVNQFVKRIEVRAVEKRKEIEEERAREARERGAAGEDAVDVSTIPREERLGPGGLDPLEVFESLPVSMQEAFESREKEKLQAALMAMPPEEAEYHMKRCVDSGLWNA
ncbi:hypothetical protein HJC23_008804 [Cyclotella cryptica]|uniref:Hsp90 chaperone protein kinase-targeting subunit n=1 Tax=Cyclotella cryptica TaxID=29204 RepID=A0ABD3PR30_9STRA|eukprot:CCRYP_012203-RA/>CCRYP_012203-RA protein AED:0.04 eAED:0.04 QI:137/1/1/1/1/1/2/151/438